MHRVPPSCARTLATCLTSSAITPLLRGATALNALYQSFVLPQRQRSIHQRSKPSVHLFSGLRSRLNYKPWAPTTKATRTRHACSARAAPRTWAYGACTSSLASLRLRMRRCSAPHLICMRVDTGRFTCLSAATWRNKASQTCQAVGAGRQLTAIRPMLRPQPGAPLSPAYAAGVAVVCSLPVELRCAHARH